MKTERRHELQHNELADRLALLIEKAQPYGRAIGGAVLLVVVAIAFFAIRANATARSNAAGWDEYYVAFNQGSEEQLNEVAKKYPGSPVAEWSKLIASDILLGQGVDQLFSDKSIGKSKLQEASDGYQSVLLNAKAPLVKQRAMFGLARAHESRGELPKAREQYEQLVKEFPNCAFAGTAEARVKQLDGLQVKQFYDWFASYEPPRGTANPNSKPLFDLPNDIDSKEGLPSDIKLDRGGDSLPSTDTLLEGSSPAGEKPAADDAKEPADVNGADAEKASDAIEQVDATSAKPAEEKPAKEQPADESKK